MVEHIFEDLKVGDTAYVEKTISEFDVYNFAGITGDFSWLHINEEKSREGHFKTRIVHGMLLVGMISNVIGNQMPGAGTVYGSQNLRFIRPCYIHDTVQARTQVIELMPAGRVKLRTTCHNQNGELIIDGEAIVIPPRKHVVQK